MKEDIRTMKSSDELNKEEGRKIKETEMKTKEMNKIKKRFFIFCIFLFFLFCI